MKTVNLFINKGFRWFENNGIFVKGYLFDPENNFFADQNLLDYFKNINNKDDLIAKLKEANGVFSVIIETEDKIMIAADPTSIFSLFYGFDGQRTFISDDILFLKKHLDLNKFDEQSVSEFLSASYTSGNKTLLKGIFQLQSAQYFIFSEGKAKESGFYYNYSVSEVFNYDYTVLRKNAYEVICNSFSRMIRSLENKPVAVPLSGGYDSRLIAAMLKKYGYQNVICYTYGKKESKEVKSAKTAAEKLGFKWIFVEYSDDLISDFINSEIFREYVHFIGKFSSMPLLQEYFAVKYLKEENLIPDNTVFIPGHSGDLLGGSQFIKVFNSKLKTKNIVNLILLKKFPFRKHAGLNIKRTKKEILLNISKFDNNFSDKFPYSVFEDYDIKEKIAKFIFNSSGVYQFFGYQHRFPFWDKELLNFFKKVPPEFKEMKKLYDDILENEIFKPADIYFKNEIQPTKKQVLFQKLKNIIKKYSPYYIISGYLEKNDNLNARLYTDQMRISMRENNLKYNNKVSHYNEIILRWYIYFCKGLIKNK